MSVCAKFHLSSSLAGLEAAEKFAVVVGWDGFQVSTSLTSRLVALELF